MVVGAPPCTFFTNGLCPYAHRVALALSWKQIAHERIEIDLSNKPSWYRKRLGTSLVPAVEIDGTPHAESLDILQLCEDVYDDATHYPSLVPSEPAQAAAAASLVRHSAKLEAAGWALLGGAWNFPSSGGAPSAAAIKKWDEAMQVLADALSKHGGPYLVGPTPTLADAALAPFVARFELAAEVCRGYSCRKANPALAAYMGALEASPAWGETFPERAKFGEAIQKYGSLDYFDYHTASLAEPVPK